MQSSCQGIAELIEYRSSVLSTKDDVFQLTEKGKAAVVELEGPEFDDLIERCKLVYKLFGKFAGKTIKDFIYRYFEDVVDRPLGAEIKEDHGRARTS